MLAGAQLGRRGQRRMARQSKLTDLTNETTASLNSAAGFPGFSPSLPSEAQRRAIKAIVEDHRVLGPPLPGMTREAAFTEMLAPASAYVEGLAAARLGVYQRSRVVRPSGGTQAPPLEQLLEGEALQHHLHF